MFIKLNRSDNRQANNAMQPTGISVPLIADLGGFGVASRRLMAGVRHLLNGNTGRKQMSKVVAILRRDLYEKATFTPT